MKQLIDLLKATPIERMEGNSQVRIIDVTADSRAVETGSLFFCLRGEHVDGHNFANMAAEMERQLLLRKRKSMWPQMLQLSMLPIHGKRWKI